MYDRPEQEFIVYEPNKVIVKLFFPNNTRRFLLKNLQELSLSVVKNKVERFHPGIHSYILTYVRIYMYSILFI
jgi:hypothetical protein